MEDKTALSILHGRLGNILFQVATNKYIARQNNMKSKFVFSTQNVHHNDRLFFDKYDLQNKLDLDMINENDIMNVIGRNPINFNEKSPIMFTKIKVPDGKNIFIHGNRQSPKYFTKKFVQELFRPDDGTIKQIYKKYPDIEQCICLHIRRGDYISEINKGVKIFKIFTLDKIIKFLDNFKEKIIIISDDITWCKNNLKLDRVEFNSGGVIEDFWIQTLCKDNIISNSTYSWWGAYLNQNKDRRVFYDSPWFNGVGDCDIIPENDNWIDINKYEK